MHQPPGRQTARRRRSCTSLAGKEGTPLCRTYHLPAMLIILLVLIQNFELHMCRQLMVYPGADKRSPDKLLTIGGSAAGEVTLPEANTPADDKRAGGSRSAPSQPEEIFSAPADEGYDEYPMVVPKRAALLLDRLMVALHHALEQERSEQRIGEFFGDRNILSGKFGDSHNGMEHHQAREDGMYSDDDAGTLLDYDFKDLNQINRATGETLMPKSFQRRAGADRSGTSTHSGSPAGSRRIQPSGSGGGRAYWRCYFNAVSCF
uniref:Allatostatin double C, isoform C n=1 Tax=Drosophila melanogaster TaxID=7227 RepID=X2J7V2_DROME|nr:allatostatin double C, isoform C [Drosophila melanogaster]AHN54344.1 allatostatin double C, isoform C [Drosophila melanogaster]|eukprot:NP_001285830.1 allatostatin double C, isoform C [Drosophila melanogaster]